MLRTRSERGEARERRAREPPGELLPPPEEGWREKRYARWRLGWWRGRRMGREGEWGGRRGELRKVRVNEKRGGVGW